MLIKITIYITRQISFFGRSEGTRTPGILLPNGPMKAISAKNSFFRPFPLGKLCSSPLLCPLFPSAPKNTVGRYVVTETLPEQKLFGERPFIGCIVIPNTQKVKHFREKFCTAVDKEKARALLDHSRLFYHLISCLSRATSF